jgi:pimeloyl-ACP methyl ester carboxylesterase
MTSAYFKRRRVVPGSRAKVIRARAPQLLWAAQCPRIVAVRDTRHPSLPLTFAEGRDFGAVTAGCSATEHAPMRLRAIEKPKRARCASAEIQLDLFYDYRTNVDLYPRFHEFFRTRQPPTLIVWGANDKIFPAAGAHAYLKDLPQAELHLLDTGHFALEDQGEEIAALMLDFFARTCRK